jgi:uncharacterized protein (TIRG00374 family)
MSAPVQSVNPPSPEEDEDDDPKFDFTPRRLALIAVFVVVSIVALYFLLPQLAGLEDTWHRIEDGSPGWLALALLFTLGSFAGYVALFQGVFVRAETKARIGWRESYQITMAGLAATRLLAAGGAGGLVLTAWALRRSGMQRRQVADKTLSFLILTYLVYMVALVVAGFGLWWGLFEGRHPFAMTVVPALIALGLLTAGMAMALVPTDFQRRLEGTARRQGRLGRWAQKAANVPASWSSGMRDALHHVRDRDPAILGAIAFWACQILVLWAAFRAFGEAPPPAILVMGFFVGMFGNLLPLPGGIGGVDGGMIGAFAAFGVDVSLAVVAVLVYRGFVFWLPTIPGAVAYFQLRKTIDRWRSQPSPVL